VSEFGAIEKLRREHLLDTFDCGKVLRAPMVPLSLVSNTSPTSIYCRKGNSGNWQDRNWEAR
jgi:hypothetical protein